jgi:hypothetical protein
MKMVQILTSNLSDLSEKKMFFFKYLKHPTYVYVKNGELKNMLCLFPP